MPRSFTGYPKPSSGSINRPVQQRIGFDSCLAVFFYIPVRFQRASRKRSCRFLHLSSNCGLLFLPPPGQRAAWCVAARKFDNPLLPGRVNAQKITGTRKIPWAHSEPSSVLRGRQTGVHKKKHSFQTMRGYPCSSHPPLFSSAWGRSQ